MSLSYSKKRLKSRDFKDKRSNFYKHLRNKSLYSSASWLILVIESSISFLAYKETQRYTFTKEKRKKKFSAIYKYSEWDKDKSLGFLNFHRMVGNNQREISI